MKSWRILHVELLKPIPSLPGEGPGRSLCLFLVPRAAARPEDCYFFRAASFLPRLVRRSDPFCYPGGKPLLEALTPSLLRSILERFQRWTGLWRGCQRGYVLMAPATQFR